MTRQVVNGRIVIEPTADLCEGAECDQLEREILEHVRQGHAVVLDLSRTRLLSARGLGILARAQSVAVEHGTRVVVCGANHLQLHLLSATRLADEIAVLDDVPAAVRLLESLRPVAA